VRLRGTVGEPIRRLLGGPIYGAYERRLTQQLRGLQVPRHVGIILDGNRRWAREHGATTVTQGHRRGADKIDEFLQWCSAAGVEVVTLWLLSTDNLARPDDELQPLLDVIEQVVSDLSAPEQPWLINPVGALDLLPDSTARALKEGAAATVGKQGLHVNIAVGYGGRREIADAVRSLLQENEEAGLTLGEVAAVLDVDHIAEHLYTKGQPDPDLVIRTSGEQRLSGFLLWQSAHSEFYFCEAYWPDFRRTDFLRGLRAYGMRTRRYGV
jgi:short-chain Z-isoprenyl diphosphate synthase